MDLFGAFGQALGLLFRPDVFVLLLIATVIAVIAGIIPAISGNILCVMILPFLFGLDPIMVLPVMCALISVSRTGGSMTAVLLGMPGDNANAATVMDGFAMTRKGQGGRGVGLALMASMMGGVVAVVLAFAMIPLVVPLVMAFKSPELFLTIVLALFFLAALTKGARLKGLIAASIGLTLSFIGYHGGTGIARLTFGNMYLYDGIDMSTALMGIMAVPILLELNATGVSIAPAGMTSAGKLGELWKGALELLRVHKKLWFISSLIGYVIGIIPALGSSTAIWLAYGRAKQASKHPEEFGKGSPEGIVAPESCNNAVEGGALLTTLVFGIPGSSIMVILLAAFLMMGVQPGPRMIVENTAICFLMLLSVAVSNIIAGVTCFFGSPILLKTTRLNPVYLYATLIPLICISAFVGRGYIVDLLVITLITFLGLCIRRYGFSAPALILGFVLGRLFEYYLLLSLDLLGPLFMFSSPICVILIALIFVSVFWDNIMIGLRHIFKGLVKEL